jgi:hypothetical protein
MFSMRDACTDIETDIHNFWTHLKYLLSFSPKYFVFPSHIKNLKTKIYKTVILPVVLYGCKTWSLTLREEHRLRVFENKVLRKIFGPKRKETDHGENCIMMNFITCILHRILLG